MTEEDKYKEIRSFLDEEGKIRQWPAKQKKQALILEYLSEKFEKDKVYTEKEVNEIIKQWHLFNDYFILRRGLIDHNFLSRKPDGSEYKLVPGSTSPHHVVLKKED
ncbi:MAG: DUF2087 domain-containing protein [bacterium]|nr:DUF2087 domain-containing protein [bacterium]